MEIVTSLPTGTPGASGGTKKHVEEWSRLDRLTGMLEHARVEADHWASNTSNSRHHFGKVVDSRARNLADGSVQQQQQTKQLEVFQAHIPGGSVQVIRSHTSTSSSWHNSKVLQSNSHVDWASSVGDRLSHRAKMLESPIDDLKLHHNLVSLETEKTKANVARFLPTRRPPTRGKLLKTNSEDDFFNELPNICLDAHNETEKRLDAIAKELKSSLAESAGRPTVTMNGVTDAAGEHRRLEKKKSISDENLNVVDEKENSDPWRRDSKARWSFQYPRSKFKDGKLSMESKSELETVLEKVLKRKGEAIEKTPTAECAIKTTMTPPWKRKSFVTEETLKETKQKLRHLNGQECKVEIVRTDNEETDDGICTESKGNSDKEDDKEDAMYVKESDIIGTGSLESRNKNKSDDWFDRRKSYGFEPVYGQRNILALKSASKTNLSTDSGICRSSELDLMSTPIVKKLTEANVERGLKSSDTDDSGAEAAAVAGKSTGVSELLSKFEKKSEARAATVVTVSSVEAPSQVRHANAFDRRESIRPGKVAELIKSLHESSIHANAFESKPMTKSGSYFADRAADKASSGEENLDQEMLSKRHSIACDDAKYIKFATPDLFHEKLVNSLALEQPSTTVVNVNHCESGDTASGSSSPFVGDTADVKKPKKVEFSKTEVHFAAAEPGKIKIVETNEKPPPANLYRRKKRSVSASPKIGLPQTRFGEKPYEEGREDAKTRATNVEPPADAVETTEAFGNEQFTSSTCDNGLAVRISSTKPSDFRRASWSVVDTANEGRSGYSTKINFGREGVTVVADAKSQKYDQFKSAETIYKNAADGLDVDATRHGVNFREKLIVRIGGCGDSSGTGAADKYVRDRFTNSFRNSIKNEVESSAADSKLKSTSLIIDTIKRSMNARVQISHARDVEMEKKINDLRRGGEKSGQVAVEQPSTYITEMNKLQQRHRIKQNRSVDKLVAAKDEKVKRIYNTVPGTKNGFARPKMLANDLPSVLSAFDSLCQSINRAIDENRNARGRVSDAEKGGRAEKSSKSWFLDQVVAQDDGDVSDDSLKADEEVRSYMSTAAMEEYENELSGSWSRRRYYKHVKPTNAAKEDEISEKSHFKPLRNEEERFKTVTSATNVDIKRPKITSVAVNLTPLTAWSEENKNTKKCTTVLLNNTPSRVENVEAKTTNERTTTNETSSTADPYDGAKKSHDSFRITTTVRSSTMSKPEESASFRQDYKPIKVIHHDVRLPERQLERRLESPKKEVSKNRVRKTLSGNSTTASNGNLRRKTAACDKDRLFDSGRDSWLNLPKERRPTTERKVYAECAKIKPTQFRKSLVEEKRGREKGSTLRKVTSDGMSNGYSDVSSAEDAHRRSYRKQVTKPLTTISERSSLKVDQKATADSGSSRLISGRAPVARTTSNSSLESRSNSYEFKNPVLKTEERSKRRAARMMQRASSREALLHAVSSSEDITSENEVGCLRSSKLKSPRKMKSSKCSKTNQPSQVTKPNFNRMIKQQTAKMEINIFNIKERPNDKKKINYPSSRSCPANNVTVTKFRPAQGQREVDIRSSSQGNRSSHRSIATGSKDVRSSSNAVKVFRSTAK